MASSSALKNCPQSLQRLSTFWADSDGGIVVIAAFAIPALAVLAIGATELALLQHDQKRMKDVADSAALSGARQLGVISDTDVSEQTESLAQTQLAELSARSTLEVDVTVPEKTKVSVRITSHRASFFGSMLPPGGFWTRAESEAENVSSTPLCVLGMNSSLKDSLTLTEAGSLHAPGCKVHSNNEMIAYKTSKIVAHTAQATSRATGNIQQAPNIGAMPVQDPLRSLDLEIPNCTKTEDLTFSSGPNSLSPGPYCGNISVGGSATLTLSPGTYFFQNGKFEGKQNATIIGRDVTLIFSATSKFAAADKSFIDLTGSKSGAFAGVVIAATKDNKDDFVFTSSLVKRLEGVIYLPTAGLIVEGKGTTVGQQSNWTAIVADRIAIKGSPSLYVNSSYDASLVPVPSTLVGAGPRLRQ